MKQTNLKHKSIKLLAVIQISFIILVSILIPQQTTAQTTDYYEKSFSWDYEGKHWTWNLSIPKALYDSYQDVTEQRRTQDGPAGYGFLTTTQDNYMKLLAQKLNQTTNSLEYGSFNQVSFVLAFVQSLPYTSDSVTTDYDEYPRFPIETLVDGGGDCEDTSILFSTLTLIMGYDTIYINPPNHYAVGVLGDGLQGTFWEYPQDSNKTYYYCETTGNNFKIGQLPDEFQNQNAHIYTINESKQFIPTTTVVPTAQPTPTRSAISTSTPTWSALPEITDPELQPIKPLSFNLISENLELFLIIISAIGISIILAVLPDKKNKENTKLKDRPFCTYCGANNIENALYCEKCGKQIKAKSAT